MTHIIFYIFFVFFIYIIPFFLVLLPLIIINAPFSLFLYLLISPIFYSFYFLLFIFLIIQKKIPYIKVGVYIFEKSDNRLNSFKIYNLCWYAIYNLKPLYFLILNVPFLRRLLWLMFGYKGSNDFIIHHDTWIKDIKLLRLGKGSFFANKAVLGTSLFLSDRSIYFGRITVGKQALIGHQAIISPGCQILDSAEVASHSIIGINGILKENSFISFFSTINHNVEIGKNAAIGPYSFIGQNSIIGDGIKIPENSNIPANSIVKDQNVLNDIIKKENELLQ